MKEKRRDQRSRLSGSESRVKSRRIRYPYSFRLKAAKLHVEEGYSLTLISEELGCTGNSVRRWVDCYREYGEEGLRGKVMPRSRSKKGRGVVGERIRKIKRENPNYGVRRISDVLRRMFLMKASPGTVGRTRHIVAKHRSTYCQLINPRRA